MGNPMTHLRCEYTDMKPRPSTCFETPSRNSRAYARRLQRAWARSEEAAPPAPSRDTEPEELPEIMPFPLETRPLAA